MSGPMVQHFFGSFVSDTAADIYLASTGWMPIGVCGTPCKGRTLGLQYYNTTTGRIRTCVSVNPTVAWYEATRVAAPVTATVGDASPSVANCTVLALPANAPAVRITNLDDGQTGQIVTLVATAAVTNTIEDGDNFHLTAAWGPNADDTITLLFTGYRWIELFRAAN
jgi:hypothetical protein